MQFSAAFVLLAVAAISMAAPVEPVDPFPTKGEVWVETDDGLTLAYLTDDAKAWQWASETEPGPKTALFETHPVPITVRPGELITSLSLDGNTCRFVNQLLDCSAKASANKTLAKAFFQAKFETDPVGDKRWFLKGPQGAFSFEKIKDELNQVSTKSGSRHLYIRESYA